jgi:hypothetical protein
MRGLEKPLSPVFGPGQRAVVMTILDDTRYLGIKVAHCFI